VIEQTYELYEMLHAFSKHKKERVVYPIPNQLNFKPNNPKKSSEFERKKFFMSVILETIYSKTVYKTLNDNKVTSVRLLKNLLADINLKAFLFYRKISEFLEDAFEKLPQDSSEEINLTLRRLMGILTIFIRCEKTEKANEARHLMGKSELIFPILNYFETAVLTYQTDDCSCRV
jgi:hypothetical protein